MSVQTIKPQPIHLKDYKKPNYIISEVDFCFELHETRTKVSSTLVLQKKGEGAPLILNGENQKLLSIAVDGKTLTENEYQLSSHELIINNLPNSFTLEIASEINPKENLALEGLYLSGNVFCTQNEPQGFRRITYFLDRSDVMSSYRTKIIADKTKYPILLSNGNQIAQGDLAGGKHWVLWEDPFPKPCYLFALVAGDLGMIQDSYTTPSGRSVDLRIYCDKGNEHKCHHAMESLKKSMKWDEDVWGLEYDLDIYMIVAVDAFNMGAMENKGLNIFNTSCVLVDPKTATDYDFLRVEAVIAHEYFHNWTGNRVTCRDWFQLTLKEGLTVFRDQEFSSDMHSRAVKRIEDVQTLRNRQFPEDAGPTAHPIKPSSYISVDNFYTPTVYEKGAEVIRMIHTFLGQKAFRKGIDLYFERHDGQAVTTEDFVQAMQDASGKDLSQFKQWYHQVGTAKVVCQFEYDKSTHTFKLHISQSSPQGSEPLHFPINLNLLGKDGKELSEINQVEVTQSEQTFVFEGITEDPIPSINRNFSAPVFLQTPYSKEDRQFLMAKDTDLFNQWESGQALAKQIFFEGLENAKKGESFTIDAGYSNAFKGLLENDLLDRSFKAMALSPPTEEILIQDQPTIDFILTHQVREEMLQQLAKQHEDSLSRGYESCISHQEYTLNPEEIGKRALKNSCLKFLSYLKGGEEKVFEHYQNATNMTDQFAALRILCSSNSDRKSKALEHFYNQWKSEPLVMVKWLAAQAISPAENTLSRVKELLGHPAFDLKIPNLVRGLLGSFTKNFLHFHALSGEGYAFLSEQIIQIDPLNPHMAASLALAYRYYGKINQARQEKMRDAMQNILSCQALSPNTYEIVKKTMDVITS